MAVKIRNDVSLNSSVKDIFKKINLSDQQVELDIEIPDSFFLNLLEEFFEREYLSSVSEHNFTKPNGNKGRKVEWIRIDRLPIHPNQNTNYDLMTRWQGALSCLHAWNYKLVFLLLRSQGKTKIFLGTKSETQDVSSDQALEQIREAIFGSMPGIGIKTLSMDEKLELSTILRGNGGYESGVNSLTEIGAITGIPSFVGSDQDCLIQTLDQLAFGIRNQQDQDRDYALLVIADPINDQEISNIIARYRAIGSQIHSGVKTSVSKTSGIAERKNSAMGAGLGIILTGGHSQWYFVKEMLKGAEIAVSGEKAISLGKIKTDPERIIDISKPQETVALGLVYSKLPFSTEVAEKKTEEKVQIKEDVPKKDFALGRYIELVMQGNAVAQYNLGVYYFHGQGVLQDYKIAFEWFSKAAEQGYAAAQNMLGIHYDNGYGVLQDYKKAFEWCSKAAEQGYADAQYNLGVFYEEGRGIPQDYKKAFEWYSKAAAQGHEDAKKELDKMTKQ